MKIKRKVALKVLLISMALFSVVSPVFAKGVGEKIGDSLTKNIGALIPAVLIAIGIYFFVVRDWMKMLSFVGIALVIGIFTNWDRVSTLAGKIYTSFLS